MCDQCERHRLPEPSPTGEAIALLMVCVAVFGSLIVVLGSLLGAW
jgi:hypothetical protein